MGGIGARKNHRFCTVKSCEVVKISGFYDSLCHKGGGNCYKGGILGGGGGNAWNLFVSPM